MIVKMRKMDILLYHKVQENFLEELRNLGVVHITAEQPIDAAMVQGFIAEVTRAKRISTALKKAPGYTHAAPVSASCDAAELMSRYEACELKREKIEQETASFAKDRAALEPWGNFDPQSIKRLNAAGIGMKFYTASPKAFDALDKLNFRIEAITVKDSAVYFVSVFTGGAPPEIADAEEARLPGMSLAALNEKIAELEEQYAAVSTEINEIARHVAVIDNFCDEQTDKLKFEEARLSMTAEADGKLLKFAGWVPQSDEAALAEFLKNQPAYVTFRDPVDVDEVPIKLKNHPISKLFQPILALYSLPGYREIDAAPYVAPFFTMFVGLCLGDAGYGLIMALGAAIAMLKVGPKMKPFMSLGVIFGLSTIFWGILLNGMFGQPMFGVAGDGNNAIFTVSEALKSKLALLESFKTAAGGDEYPAMSFALVVGFVHMFFGMIIQSVVQMKGRGFQAGLQPIANMFMVFGGVVLAMHTNFLNIGMGGLAIGEWALGQQLMAAIPAETAKYMALGGLGMLLLFNNVDKKIFIRPLTGLWALYNFSTGFFSNALSYLRLFALGLAGGLLGGAVNGIAHMFVTDASGNVNYASIGVVATVIIMVCGHALNLALAALGAFVHPLRLTFVEFYGAIGFQGGASPYVPFAKSKK